MEERIRWLEFRDEYVSKLEKQKQLQCHYCTRNIFSDVPKHIKKPKDRIFKRLPIPAHKVATIDHIVPVSKGGEKFNHANMVLCCPRCNQHKKAKLLVEWDAPTAYGRLKVLGMLTEQPVSTKSRHFEHKYFHRIKDDADLPYFVRAILLQLVAEHNTKNTVPEIPPQIATQENQPSRAPTPPRTDEIQSKVAQ